MLVLSKQRKLSEWKSWNLWRLFLKKLTERIHRLSKQLLSSFISVRFTSKYFSFTILFVYFWTTRRRGYKDSVMDRFFVTVGVDWNVFSAAEGERSQSKAKQDGVFSTTSKTWFGRGRVSASGTADTPSLNEVSKCPNTFWLQQWGICGSNVLFLWSNGYPA